jgi:hypothetical protein
MKTERDKNGRLRIAKNDASHLGGQYAPDFNKQQENLNRLNNIENEEPQSQIKVYPYYVAAGAGVAMALPGSFAGVFNGLSFLGMTVVAGALTILMTKISK